MPQISERHILTNLCIQKVGPAGGHFGLLACSMVEVIHQWPRLKYPEMALLKMVGVTAVLFLAGLLPWVDNYAHLFGFIFGFLLSYALLPFVTFGTVYDRRRKSILVWTCFLSVVFLFVGLVLLFYVTPIHDCEVCKVKQTDSNIVKYVSVIGH